VSMPSALRRQPPTSSTPLPYTTLFRSPSPCRRSPVALSTSTRGTRGCPTTWRTSTSHAAPTPFSLHRPAQTFLPNWHTVWQTTRSEEHTSELQSRENLVCRLLLEKKKL